MEGGRGVAVLRWRGAQVGERWEGRGWRGGCDRRWLLCVCVRMCECGWGLRCALCFYNTFAGICV